MFMYQDKFVACLKVGKDILREDKDTVLLPFGSEYSIYMKNLEGRTAVVSVSLDGQDVLDGHELVLYANHATVLEGFLKGTKVDGKFRFIQKTAKIQEHRGDKIDDGLLRISFRFEKPRPIPTVSLYRSVTTQDDFKLGRSINHNSVDEGRAGMSWSVDPTTTSYSGPMPSADAGEDKMTKACDLGRGVGGQSKGYRAGGLSAGGQSISLPRPEEGITVKGSDSAQTFRQAVVGELETEVHVIVIKLMGVNPETAVAVEQPVTVKTKKECPTCGTVNKQINKFCRECSTRLG